MRPVVSSSSRLLLALRAGRSTARSCRWLLLALLAGCIEEVPTATSDPLTPPLPPGNPAVLSAAWRLDVDRVRQAVRITPPVRGLGDAQLASPGGGSGVAAGASELSLLAGDAVDIVVTPGTFVSSAVGAYAPGLVRTSFDVEVRNKLSAAGLTTPTFPAPPAGTSGVLLFPFETVVTETPGVVSGGDVMVIELPSHGVVVPSVDWDGAPFNFFNDASCGAASSDCYRSETFRSRDGSPKIPGGGRSEIRRVGFDHDPTVSHFRVKMILAGDLVEGEG